VLIRLSSGANSACSEHFWQPNYPTGIFDFSADVTICNPVKVSGTAPAGQRKATRLQRFFTRFAAGGQLNIVPAVADKSKETAFFRTGRLEGNARLTVNVGLRTSGARLYSERQNRLQLATSPEARSHHYRPLPHPDFAA